MSQSPGSLIETDRPAVSSLGTKAVSGVLWTTGLNVFRDFLQFGITLVLVRLLRPEAYGQFGLITAILGFLGVFSFRPFLEYTLQIRGGQPDYQTHFTGGAVIQAVLFLCTNLTAAMLRWSHTYAPVAPAVHVMSILFLLDLGNGVRELMLERQMNWGRLRTLQGFGVISGAIVALTMAAAGAGVYALLVPSLAFSIPTIIDLLFIQRWRPTWKWDADAFKPARSYGFTRLTSAFVMWGRQILESTILVKIAGFALYGIYGRALGLAAICCLKVPSLLTQSLFPVLTKLNPGSGTSNKATTLVFCSVAWTTFPLAILFSALASPVVHTIYGARWSDAIPFVPSAIAASTATAMTQTGAVLLVSTLQHKRSLLIDSFTLAGALGSLVFLAPRSLTWYLIAIASIQSAGFLLMLVWLYRTRCIALHGIATSLVLPAMNAALAFVATGSITVRLAISRETVGGAICYGAIFCLIYVLLIRFTSRQQCREIVHLLPGRSYLQRWLVLET